MVNPNYFTRFLILALMALWRVEPAFAMDVPNSSIPVLQNGVEI